MELEYLDDTWITQFTKEDKLYQEFYKDDLYFLNLTIIYINRTNEIEKIKANSLLLNEKNKLCQEEIVQILKSHAIDNDKRYTLLSILKYNIHMNPEEVIDYLKHPICGDSQYLSVVTSIDTILFHRTISMFQDLNELTLLFYERGHSKATTKKSLPITTHKHKKTKRHY